MPKQLTDHELRPVLDAFEGSTGPLSIDELNERLVGAPPRRTLQRWLAALVEAGRLRAHGERGGRRYSLPSANDARVPLQEEIIPLSSVARSLRDQILRPQSARKPVGYNPDFLGDYEPNVSAYLSEDQIEDAFEQSFFIMVHLPYLQPFEDVNKRTSRLAANIPLIKHNLGPLSFVDVPEDDYKRATLTVYELNRVEYLREVYVWAYERSCARYAAIRQSLGEPDPFRLGYRLALTEVVSEVVRKRLNKTEAVAFLKKRGPELVQADDRARFMVLAESELAGLHEGNFARFRIRPSEFKTWKSHWK